MEEEGKEDMKANINFPILIVVLIMFLYIFMVIIMLEIVYFEKTLTELVEAVNLLAGG